MMRLMGDRRIALGILIAIAIVAMGMISPYFLEAGNLLSLMQYSSVVGLLAIGQSLVILGGGGGIDLSVGSMLSLSSITFGLLAVDAGWSPWLAALGAIVAGALLGLFNGVLINVFNMPPLIVTLGTLYLYGSLALVLANGLDINGFDRDGFSILGQSTIFGIPTQVIFVLIPSYAAVAWVMSRTRFGREVYETGSNAIAARISGVNVKWTRIKLYAISGVFSAMGAVVTASWLLNAKSTAGVGQELQAITIAVLGGIVITGGVGRVSGTLLALVLVAVLNSGMALAGVGSTYQIGLLGVVLIVSVLVRHKSAIPSSVP